MTVAETRQYIGDTLEVRYYNGSNYVTTTATYTDGSSLNFEERSDSPVQFVAGNHLWLRYDFTATGLSLNPDYISIRIEPAFSIYDTRYVYTCLGLGTYGRISASVYQSPICHWLKGGNVVSFENSTLDWNDPTYHSFLFPQQWTPAYYSYQVSYIPVVMTDSSDFSASCLDVSFFGNDSPSNYPDKFTFYVMCPYVSTGSTGGSGVITTAPSSGTTSPISSTTSSSGGGGGGASDLTETNSLIGRVITSISNAVDSLLEGIKGLFVPDDDFLSDWVDDMKDLLSDHLGGLYEAIDLLTDFYDIFQGIQAKQNIHIDSFNVPLAGQQLQLGGWDIPLKVNGLPAALYDGIAYIFDFLAVMIFLKMCRNKLEIILNPDSEVVQSDR